MGFFDLFKSSKSQQTKFDPKNADQLSDEDLYQEILLSGMESAGWIPEQTEKTVYKDEGKAKKIQDEIASLEEQKNNLKNEMAILRDQQDRGGQGGNLSQAVERKQYEISQNERKISDKRAQLSEIGSTTYTDYTLVKQEDPRVLQAMYEEANKNGEVDRLAAQYGFESKEVRDYLRDKGQSSVVNAVRQQVFAEQGELASLDAQAQKDLLIGVNKILAGEIAPTDEQKAQVRELFAPVRKVFAQATENMIAQAEMFGTNMMVELNKIREEVTKSGVDTLEFLDMAGIQMEKTGQTLLQAASELNQSEKAYAEAAYSRVSREIDASEERRAALLGLPPGSEQARARAQARKLDAVDTILLAADVRKSEREFGIKSSVEQGKIDLSLAKVNLAESQGAKKEALARLGFDTKASVEGAKLSAKGAESQGLIDLSKAEAETLYGISYGNIASAIGAAGQGLNLGRQDKAFDLAAQGQLAGQSSFNVQQEAAARAAQGKTTVSTTPSGFGILSNVAKIGLSAATGGSTGLLDTLKGR